jgi:type II secretory ATPase GspE/PulE/Tfp pilus assembly ATPase PilB-like protein
MSEIGSSGVPESYPVTCWNCLGEFDALRAVWCSDDAKNPSKVCPFCFRCFCEASPRYKQDFWTHAPAHLVEELETLARSKDRLGDILIRMKKLTTPQLLEVLIAQKKSDKKLGEILVEHGLVAPEDIRAALASQGVNPLTDTEAVPGAAPGGARPYWEQASPEAIIDYLLNLAARKGASDVSIEPREDQISVRYRIDGFSFRVESVPKHLQDALTARLFDTFHLDPDRSRPQTVRTTSRLGNEEYDIVAQALPALHGVSTTLKLVHRGSFIKDFATLGLEMDDRVRLIEELQAAFGLVLVTSPAFSGSITTAYSIMSYLVQSHRDVLSLESPIHWLLDGSRQVEVEPGPGGPRMEETLHSVMAVRPDVLMLSAVPDEATAVAATRIASSRLVVATETAQSAAQGLVAFQERGVPPQQLAGSLAAVTGQRLVRTICRSCRTDAEPPADQTLSAHGIPPEEAGTLSFYRGQGCPACNNVGYRGRRAIFEVMPGTPEVRGAVENGLSASELEVMATAAGMTTIRDRCLHLVREGITTFDEFTRLKL